MVATAALSVRFGATRAPLTLGSSQRIREPQAGGSRIASDGSSAAL
jgi:hypothetical protein